MEDLTMWKITTVLTLTIMSIILALPAWLRYFKWRRKYKKI